MKEDASVFKPEFIVYVQQTLEKEMQIDIRKADVGEGQLTAGERETLQKRQERLEYNRRKLFESPTNKSKSQAQNLPILCIDSLVRQIRASVT